MRAFKFKVVGIAVLSTLAAGLCSAASFDFEQVDPAATYGTPAGGGSTDTAVWIALSSLNNLGTITPGSTLLDLIPVGETCFVACPTSSPYGETGVASLTPPIFIAGFTATSGSTTFLTTTLGTFNTGGGGSGDWTNTFNHQFGIDYNSGSGTGYFTIPTGANYLVVVFRDDYYQDNFDGSGTFGVDAMIENPVPEPASYAMMLGGLGLLVGWRRLRRS